MLFELRLKSLYQAYHIAVQFHQGLNQKANPLLLQHRTYQSNQLFLLEHLHHKLLFHPMLVSMSYKKMGLHLVLLIEQLYKAG